MERYRLKNIIILILVMVNLFLLGSAGLRLSREHTAQTQLTRELTQLFESAGVSLDAARLPDQLPPAVQVLTRDTAQDQTLAAFLLGEGVTGRDMGGGIHAYQTDLGSALFRASGNFDAAGTLGGQDPAPLWEEFCTTFHYEGDRLPGDAAAATATQTWGGCPVVNATVTAQFENGVLSALDGVHLPENHTDAASDKPLLSAPAALLAFLRDRQESGAVVSAVSGIQLCYELQSSAAALMTLVPVWRLTTDGPIYYVNCLTGEVRHN